LRAWSLPVSSNTAEGELKIRLELATPPGEGCRVRIQGLGQGWG
jgi:hypothetical protein